jgi:hypothetical protein
VSKQIISFEMQEETFTSSNIVATLQQKVFMVLVENLYFVSAPATDMICMIQKMNGL